MPMLQQLKISVYNIKINTSSIPEAAPDHNFHILICSINLYDVSILFLRWCAKALFLLTTMTTLYQKLITSHNHSLLLLCQSLMVFASAKSFCCILFCDEWLPFTVSIANSIVLQDFSKAIFVTSYATGVFILYIGHFRI